MSPGTNKLQCYRTSVCRNLYNERQQLQPIRCTRRNSGTIHTTTHRFWRFIDTNQPSFFLTNYQNIIVKEHNLRHPTFAFNWRIDLNYTLNMHILKDVNVQYRKQHREEDTMMNEVNYILSAAEQINEVNEMNTK